MFALQDKTVLILFDQDPKDAVFFIKVLHRVAWVFCLNDQTRLLVRIRAAGKNREARSEKLWNKRVRRQLEISHENVSARWPQ